MVINLNRDTEQKLIEQCAAQDRRAQRTIYERYAPIMLSICKRYIADADLAEEQMIVGFMKMFKKLDQFRFEGSFEGWVRRIMVTTCLSWIRKNKTMYKEVDIDEVSGEPDIQMLESHLEAEDLMKLIGELPQGYRTIFNMYAIEGFSHNEIAKELKISVSTSKSQLSRARKYLQQKLKEMEMNLDHKIQGHGSKEN